jgi:AmiR/NasT family two-component response regulator
MATDHNRPDPQAGAAFQQLDDLVLADHSLQSVLQRVADLAREVIPGRVETSVSLLTDERATTVSYTDQLCLDLDAVQYAVGDGPCLRAATTGKPVEIRDARTESRWPDYVPQAIERGSLSSLSVPLGGPEGLPAALNVYARQAAAFDETSRTLAERFASFAGIAVTYMYAYQSVRDLAENLQTALASRAVIDQAKGILIERYKVTPDRAFTALATVSMRTNSKLRDLAARLVDTGELPGLADGLPLPGLDAPER